jgi:Protein of unknown function (DUF3500)
MKAERRALLIACSIPGTMWVLPRALALAGRIQTQPQGGLVPDNPDDHGHRQKRTSRRSLLRGAGAAGLLTPLSRLAWAVTPAVAADMARAGVAWLITLDERQRREGQLLWTNPGRGNWHYVPRNRPGLALRAMNERQIAVTWDLLGSLLSARGLEQVRGQLTIERILGELTGSRGFRDPGNYALVMFGDPSGTAPWAWRFEGHHLSISVLVAPGHGVAATPAFSGANPALVPQGHVHACKPGRFAFFELRNHAVNPRRKRVQQFVAHRRIGTAAASGDMKGMIGMLK